ncbi:uncharacterized protein LOC123427194 isoform X1 [Hordeum vulgare subsp. vulgare]|uniref:uncharacterized protein LOC123427194 isoform X1 n=1 Tax=Hordeum vulgare subsp. vulgare TaxID=112509 RepID=UPI0002950218|nr:uncharacterized protein LOC123427194 isoform X1 [Hordeum vulgare subsp. vulgare]XP_044967112.1 uncharacterized protein LOC123427194 isoform X1 [Hordeum vulgare subsp. vulgare]
MLGGSGSSEKKTMINLFDLSTGMASTKALADRTHREDSPVRRGRTDIKRTVDPDKVCIEDKLEASTRSSLSSKSDASPMKKLLANEIAKEVESKRKPPSVVARLMGLEDDLPAQEQALHSPKRNLRRSQLYDDYAATKRTLQQQEQRLYNKTTRGKHIGPKETVEFKDVYAVCEEPLRTHHLQDQTSSGGRSSQHKSDARIEVVRQKFIQAKRLATDENFLHSKEFQEALEVLSSNKDLFLKFLEEPSSVFSNPLYGQNTMPAPPQTKRITVLKPFKSAENIGARETRTHRVDEENEFVMGKSHKRSHSAEDTFSKPNRIVVLKPNPGKPNRTHARLTPRSSPFEPQESLLSSVYSNGYNGDESSLSRSEADNIDEDGGSLSDSEVVSPVSRHSWDYIKRYSSTYSSSTHSRASHSHSAESSVIKEAKRRLSERWTTVACDEISHQEVKLPRTSRTLGDMLSIRETEKEENVAVINSASSSRSCGKENELAMQSSCVSILREDETGESSPRNLARSKSLPVSSAIFHNMVVSANSEGCETPKVDTRQGKGKLSFKGKVSSFFFPRSKRLAEEKTILPSDSAGLKVEVTFLEDKRSETNSDLQFDERMAFCKDKADNFTIQTDCSLNQEDVGSMEAPVSSDCPSGCTDEPISSGSLKCMRDQPSPTSVFDASFEDSSTNEPESSKSTSACNERVALRSPAIESVPRLLSWEGTYSHSPLHMHYLNSSNAEDNESECYALVQKIVSSAGLGNLQVSMVFTGWHLADCPLDPALCDKFLDRKEEAAKSRERRSNQKLLFDCVNMALVETGQEALLRTYPWGKACFGARSEALSQDLGEEVWSHVRDWLYGAERFAANEYGDAAMMLERIVHQEVEVGGWMKSARSEADEITKQIADGLLEQLIGEAAADLAFRLPQQGVPMPVPDL